MKPEEQCPSCQFNTYAKICGKGRARINQDVGGMFYKTIPCPIWMAKMAPLVNLEICPTCGQKLPLRTSDAINRILGPSETRISELVEIEKKAQQPLPGIIPDEPSLSPPVGVGIKREKRRSSGNKRARKNT